MKKIILALLLVLISFGVANSQSIRIGEGNVYYVGGDSNYFKFSKQGFFPFGLKTFGTSTFNGSGLFNSANLTVANGILGVTGTGYIAIGGTNITSIFSKLSGRNTFSGRQTMDSLLIGSGLFTFGSSTLTLSGADFYSGTIGTADLTVGHELNVTGASITGFNAVKISVDTITAPDEIVNIYGGLNILSGGYQIYGRTENQNITFTRHYPDGDLSSYVMGSTGTTISYYDSVTATTTALKVGNGTITANDSAIATRNWVRNNAVPYKVYRATLSQTGTSAPVATVLENTLGGTVVWSYLGNASYQATLAGGFTVGKTIISPDNVTFATGDYFTATDIQANFVEVSTNDNGVLPPFFTIEIRVYN